MQRQRKYRIKWFRLTIVGLVVYFIYLCVGQQAQLNAIKRETENANVQLEQLQETNAQLTEERALLSDPAYVEKLAREELGLVKPGETPYILVDKKLN